MRARRRLKASIQRYGSTKQDKPEILRGLLGFVKDGVKTVLHPTRKGWNYVRLRGDTSETVVAFNDQVQPVYDLPVLLQRDAINPSFYRVTGRDIGVYMSWGGTQTGGISKHAPSHERNPRDPGNDIVNVYSQQFQPLAIVPNSQVGVTGSPMSVWIQPDHYLDGTTLRRWPGSGTVSFSSLKPTDVRKRFVSVFLDSQTGLPYYLTGTPFVDILIPDYAAYIPLADMTRYIPSGAILLTSGSSSLDYADFIDLRHFGGYLAPTGLGTDYIARAMTWMGL